MIVTKRWFLTTRISVVYFLQPLLQPKKFSFNVFFFSLFENLAGESLQK